MHQAELACRHTPPRFCLLQKSTQRRNALSGAIPLQSSAALEHYVGVAQPSCQSNHPVPMLLGRHVQRSDRNGLLAWAHAEALLVHRLSHAALGSYLLPGATLHQWCKSPTSSIHIHQSRTLFSNSFELWRDYKVGSLAPDAVTLLDPCMHGRSSQGKRSWHAGHTRSGQVSEGVMPCQLAQTRLEMAPGC
jgi:hypothetical protein